MTDHLSQSDRDKLRDAWFEYRNEADKFLFTGSAAGIGFCLHQVFSESMSRCEGVLLLVSAALFGVVCSIVVLIFKRNAHLMARLLGDAAADTRDIIIEVMDWTALVVFALAVVVLIISSAIHVLT